MKKPFGLSTRKMAAAITRINNALPLFPGATEASKFSPEEVIGLLEWSLPQTWRNKFDLDGYIPSLDSKLMKKKLFSRKFRRIPAMKDLLKTTDDSLMHVRNIKLVVTNFHVTWPQQTLLDQTKNPRQIIYLQSP